MFSRLLVPVELNLSTDAVVDCLAGLKAYGARHCLLLYCITLHELNPMMLEHVQEEGEKKLKCIREKLERQGFCVETRCQTGLPNQMINQIANDENYSMIVVGAFAHTLLNEAFLGGLAYDVIHFANKPVLLIRLQESENSSITCLQAPECDLGKNVLFPTDFSANADQAFAYVQKLVKAGIKEVTLLHVQDQYRLAPYLLDRLDEFNQEDEARLQELRQTLLDFGAAEVKTQLCFGSPILEILRAVEEKAISLVVMGSQGRGFVKELLLGSVSHNVARHAKASVLLIPAMRE